MNTTTQHFSRTARMSGTERAASIHHYRRRWIFKDAVFIAASAGAFFAVILLIAR